MRKVGIIGWLWPETTAEFYLDVIFSCQRKNRERRAGIMIGSVPLPFEIEQDCILRWTSMERYIPFLIAEAQKLETAGVDFIVMPCNSLHIFLPKIRESVTIPVLSIVEETVKFIHKNGFKKVGVVSTSATIKNKLYEEAFEKNNIHFVAPETFEQEKMWKIILNLVSGQQRSTDRDTFIDIIHSFESKNVDCVILACTDLQLLIPKHPKLEVFDTMKIFADVTVENILQ